MSKYSLKKVYNIKDENITLNEGPKEVFISALLAASSLFPEYTIDKNSILSITNQSEEEYKEQNVDKLHNDFKEEISFFRIKDLFDKELKKETQFEFEINPGDIRKVKLNKEEIINFYYFYFMIIEKNDLKKLINALNKIDLKEARNKTLSQNQISKINQEIENVFDMTSIPGEGKNLLRNIINSSEVKDFKVGLCKLFYRKLIERKSMKLKSTTLTSNTFNFNENILSNFVDQLISLFKDTIEIKQAGFSTTLGGFFEIIIDKQIKNHIGNNKKQKAIINYNINTAAQKTAILLLLMIQRKFKSGNSFYNKLTRSSNSNVDWNDMFDNVYDDIGDIEKINKINILINVYLNIMSLNKSNCLCFEYESDRDLYMKASELNIKLPKANAPFDFIIRQDVNKTNDSSPLKLGLFDLKCTNQYSSSSPLAKGTTGSNLNNSAIKNIQDTLNCLNNLNNNSGSELSFIGLSEVTYLFKLNGSNLSIEIGDVKNKISPAKSSIQFSKEKQEFYVSKSKTTKDNEISEEDLSKYEKNNANFVIWATQIVTNDDRVFDDISYEPTNIDYKDEIDLCKVLSEKGYNGKIEDDIFNQWSAGGSDMMKKIFDKPEFNREYFKYYKKLILKEIKNKKPSDYSKIELIINQLIKDETFDLYKIANNVIQALINNKTNKVKNLIVNTLQNSKLAMKRTLSSYILLLFKRSSSSTDVDNVAALNPEYVPNKLSTKFTFNSKNHKKDIAEILSKIKRQIAFKNKELDSLIKRETRRASTVKPSFSSTFDSRFNQRMSPRHFYKGSTILNTGHKVLGNNLQELYSNLFEGGLGGHMSHPYEVLDKTPKELIKRIKEYGVPQKIIEKVDGQNLFFTITKEGQVMFARNSNDMAYDDLIEKFTNHGAEKPFVQGGTAIKRAVDDWVSSNPDFTLNDIETIFHPAEGSNERYQSFINFEIMHPESPNQIEYDKKYIVFHSIIDFEYDQTGKRSEVIGSNSDQRLQKIFNSLKNHIAQYDFELASNREVEINVLTSVQISDYIEKINKVADTLGITEDETLEEGVISHISNKLKQSGVNLDYDSSKALFDFVLYGEDSKGTKLTGRAVTKGLDKEVAKVLRELGLTNKSKAAAMISRILSPFKGIFVDLGIDLLKGVESAYMSRETGEKNIKDITEKLRLAISDYESYMTNTPEDGITNIAKRLQPYVDKIKQIGIDNAITSPVEGGVYSVNSDLEKITGGFAPMNQILGAAYRDKEDIFPEFQDQYLQKESKNSLKKIFSSIF